jgi:hypothetical protein
MSRLGTSLRALTGAAIVAAVASCDSPTRLPSTGSIAPRIELVRRDTTGRASAVLPPTSMRARAIGPTAASIDLVLTGGFWTGRLENLTAGTYEVIIEGLANGQVQYYGRVTGVDVVRGQTASPPIPFAEAVPAVNAPSLPNTTSFSQRLVFNRVPGATNYTVEYGQDETFVAGVTSFVSADTNPLITVTQPGTWYMRTRAILPNILASSVPWSDVRSWVVIQASNGDDDSDAIPVTAPPSTPQQIGSRNLTLAKRADWFEFDVRQGDSLFVETFAQRLTPNASSLNTVLHIFRQDGTTEIGTNDNTTGTTDSRVVAIAPATERAMVRVTGANATTVGHFELAVEIRRLPYAPEDLAATVVSGTQVNLAWTDLSDNETGFDIERCVGATCDVFTMVTTTAANAESYNDAALTLNNEYRWRVRARNAVGTSAYTAIVNAATMGPATPTGLGATTISNTRIDLAWTDVATNETGYEVERCTGVACTTGFTNIATLPAGASAHSDVTAAYNQTYVYRVRAVNNVVASDYGTTATANTIPPATPTGLTAAVGGPTRIDLQWTDASTDEIGFRIERCLGDVCVNFAEIATVGAGVSMYQDNGVANNAGYRYRVRAYHAVTSQTYSNIANADTRPPTAPTLLTATTTSGTSISLTWQDNSDDELDFSVQRCSSGPTCTDFTQIATAGPGAQAYVDNSVVVGNTYRYQVVALGLPGNSAPTNIVAANTLLPVAPTGLTATTIDATNIQLNWTDNSNNEASWEISRCTGAACPTPTPYDTIPAGTATYTDAAAVPGTSYVYAVRAMNVSGRSAPTNNAAANTLPPSAPTSLTATTVSGTQVDLAWTNTDASITGTRVERCEGEPCGAFAEIAFVPQPAASYNDVSAVLGTKYQYRIRAQNAADVSAYTATAAATTELPNAPTGLQLWNSLSSTQLSLAWTPATGPGTLVGQLIERCEGLGCTTGFVVIDSLDAAATTYVNPGLTPESDYGYRVRAVNVVGRSQPTAVIAGTTRTPETPTGLVATVMPGIIRLTWTDNADNEDGVVIERCDGGGCATADLATRFGSALETWDDSSVVANTEYTYRVRTFNHAGVKASSAEAFANTLIADPVTVLTATAVSPTQVDLAWDPSPSQGTGLVVGYNVYRCDGTCDPATGTLLVAVGAGAVSHQDATAAADAEYTYAVLPYTAFGETAFAGSATAFASTALPTAPTNLVGTLMSPTSIQLNWADNSDDEIQFEVAQCAGAGCTGFTTVATTGTDVASFLADTLTFSVEYRFLVRAVNTAGASAWTDTLSIGTTVPAVPTALVAFVTDGSGDISLGWNDVSDDESQFEIDLCTGADCETWALFSTVPNGASGAVLSGLGTSTYRMRVRAVNAAGSSLPSTPTQITGGAPYASPTGTIATTMGPTSIRVTWTDQTDNETDFQLMRCTGVGCDPMTGTEVGVVPRDGTEFDDTGVPTGEIFFYAVLARNGAGVAPSAAFDGHTRLPDAPVGLMATTLSNTEIALAWGDGGFYETGYVIERCVGVSCGNFAAIDTVPADFVAFNDIGLSPNATYRYRVLGINAVGESPYSNVVERATDLPATPTALSALPMTATRIDLAWTDNATNEDFYIVERCAGTCDASGTFLEIETGLAPNAQAYADNGVSAGQTYSYRVRALNAGGVSPTTNIATATTAAPLDPTNLTATTLSGTQIALTWSDNASNELSYQVERCTSATCPTFTLRATLPADATGYTDAVAVDDEYTYRVRAVNNVGPSGYTGEATANTITPAAASGFTVTTVSGTRIDLTWTDNATNEDGYVLERCSGVDCSDFAVLDSLPPDASGYQNDGIATQTSFTYRLYAYNIAGPSAISGPSTATTITPAGPTALSAVLAAPGQIDLSWTDNATNELQYRVERCIGSSNCATPALMDANAIEVATLSPDANFYSDGGLAPSTLYFYRVRATNTAGSSPFSAIVSRSTSVPPAPTGLSSFTQTATRVDLFWSDASANEDGFRIERCIGPDPCTVFTQIAQVPANTQTYSDETITAEPFVYYRVLAFNGGGGNASNVSFASTIVPAAPTALTAAPDGLASVSLTWTDNAGDETGFYVERCVGLDCLDFTRLDTLPANTVAFDDASATAGNVYRYRVQAFGNGRSDYTAIAEAATIGPNAPTDLVATALSDTRVDLTWTDNTPTDSLWNELQFVVLRCAGVACTPVVVHATVGPDTTFFSDSLLTPGETYSYQVVATNLAAGSAPSNVATSATTVPAIPTALADSTISASDVLLSWVDNANNETGYEIEGCEGASCTGFALVATTAADAQSHLVTGLVGGTVYRFRIRGVNASGNSGYSNEVVAQADVPPAPTALTGVQLSPTRVDLSWADNAENETAYIIERCDGDGCTPTIIDSLPANVTSYSDLTIAIDTAYYYRVRASNLAGPSPYTLDVKVNTYRPATPTGLAATPISATRVDLSWTDVATNDTVIVVERCLGFECNTFADVALLPPDATSYSDLTVTVNNTYNYRLRAENAAGASASTDSVEVGTFIPSDPTGLTATTDSPTQITLTWADNSDTELDFRIERCVGASCDTFAELAIVAADVSTFQDLTATIGNEYGYRVTARGGGGNSNPSNVAVAHTFPAGAVASLTAVPLTPTTAQLSWTAADYVSSYQIATVSGSDTTAFAPVSAGVTDTVVTVTTGLVYTFVVRAINNAGAGEYAGAELAMTPPPAPVNLTVFPLTTSQAALAWADTTARETGFEVQRSFFSGSFGAYTTVSTLGANVTADVDEVPAATGRYRYRVRAVNQIGAGPFSNEVDLTLTAPAAPTALNAAVSAPGQITLTWTDNSDSEQSFFVERSVGNNVTYAQIATLGPGVQSHVDSSGLTINTTYYYRVRAGNSIGASGFTNEATTTTTVPNGIASMVSVILSSTSIQLTWDGSPSIGESGFRVYRCVGVGCLDFTLIDGFLPADATTYTDVTASYGNLYRYQVRPYNIAGEPASNLTHQRVLVLPAPSFQFAIPTNRTAVRTVWSGVNQTWETGFEVEQCVGFNCADFAPLATLPANDTSFVAAGLTPNGAWYRYRVRAVADGNLGPWSIVRTTNTPREVSLGNTLVSVSPEEISANNFMTHYVVAMPGGSPTVEVSIGDDPGGTTSSGGSYLIMSRSKGIERHAGNVATLGVSGDTLCSPPVFVQSPNSGSCSLPQLGVTTDFYITTYSNPYTNLYLTVLPGPTTYTFNNCGQTGRFGPSQGQCDAVYAGASLGGQVTVSGSGFQDWQVPFSGRWVVTAIGAAGVSGDPARLGGRGAQISGEFVLTAGQNLRMAVGQMGSGAASNLNGGGGGGSFVYDVDGATPMLIAGGGGGTRAVVDQNGCDASVTVFATIASGGATTTPCTVKVTDAGLGGIVSSYSWGSGGAGFNGNGAGDLDYPLAGGRSWANLILGGDDPSWGGFGGFGGAGAGYGGWGGGGGGGYSGGDGGRVAGGGGSFNAGTNAAAVAGVGTGHGTIILRYLGPATP